jgi:indoleamine 2,3-dioxygenase
MLNNTPLHPVSAPKEAPEAQAETELKARPGRPMHAAPTGVVEATFLNRMLQYMPLPHRTFLLHLSSHPTPLRELVIARQDTHPALAAAYDEALAALRRFRDKHMRVVSRFIVVQARRQPSERVQKLLPPIDAAAAAQVSEDALRGTGGTPLIRFLKRCRDNTSRAMVNE